MQSNSAIALFTKMKMLYEKENKFLAFPAAAVSWKAADFAFSDMDTISASDLEKSLQLAANFSKGFNFIAETATRLTYDDRNLWDIYRNVLDQKILSNGGQTTSEKTRITQLREYLFILSITRSDGSLISRQDNYDLYQSVYFEVLNEYNTQKITATYSTEQMVKDLWTANEPVLKAKLDKTMGDFVLKGLKNEVKNANDELINLSSKGPFTTWQGYTDDFDRSKFTQAELGGVVDFDFYATLFYPADFYRQTSTSWNKFTLIKSEIEALCASAPDELDALISSISIKSLTAEIAYVDIRRPWMHAEIFQDTNWKLPDNVQRLSDGHMPASGRMPAIPVAVIFARNMKIEMDNPGTTPPIKNFINPAIFSNLAVSALVKKSSVQPMAIVSAQPTHAITNTRITDMRRMVTVAPLQAKTIKTTTFAQPVVTAAQPVVTKVTNLKRITFNTPKKNSPVSINKTLFVNRLQMMQLNTLKKDTQPAPPPSPENEVEIVAFVCQKLPVCPNPAPGLTWL